MNTQKKKYIIVLIITLGIFIAVFSLVSFLDSKKIKNISNLQNKITLDLIANETQFDLLKNAPCKAIGGSTLSRQLGEIGEKLSFAEQTQGIDKQEVIDLKKYYSLLQVKDYLLSQEVAEKCDIEIESIVYFYNQDCPDCIKQGYVLTELKKKYPWLRIYSFDRYLDFSIVETFASLYDLSEESPIIIIGGEKYSGFKSIEDVETYIPELIHKKEREYIKEQGIDFIKSNEEFSHLLDLDFNFISYENDTLTYSYIEEKDGVLREDTILLYYSAEDKGFSLIEE